MKRPSDNDRQRPRVRREWEIDDDRRMRAETLRRILHEVPRVSRPPVAVNRRRPRCGKVSGWWVVAMLGGFLAAGVLLTMWLREVLERGAL